MYVQSMWRYPVKSMMGEHVDSATILPVGMLGDRGWAVRDEVRGGIRGAKKIGGLMRFAARYATTHEGGAPRDEVGLPGTTALEHNEVVITLPDGTEVTSSAEDVNEVVSAALDHRVTLWPLQPVGDLDHYRRGAPDSDDIMVEIRDIFGRTEEEPLPDLSVFPPEIIEFESPPGTYVDAYPILVMTTSAIRSIEEALPDAAIDMRRFRPNILVDTGEEPGHPELGWEGKHLCAGEVELELVTGCARCVMVTREIDADVPTDRSVLRYIVADLDQLVGMYANVVNPGTVREGDPVHLS